MLGWNIQILQLSSLLKMPAGNFHDCYTETASDVQTQFHPSSLGYVRIIFQKSSILIESPFFIQHQLIGSELMKTNCPKVFFRQQTVINSWSIIKNSSVNHPINDECLSLSLQLRTKFIAPLFRKMRFLKLVFMGLQIYVRFFMNFTLQVHKSLNYEEAAYILVAWYYSICRVLHYSAKVERRWIGKKAETLGWNIEEDSLSFPSEYSWCHKNETQLNELEVGGRYKSISLTKNSQEWSFFLGCSIKLQITKTSRLRNFSPLQNGCQGDAWVLNVPNN